MRPHIAAASPPQEGSANAKSKQAGANAPAHCGGFAAAGGFSESVE